MFIFCPEKDQWHSQARLSFVRIRRSGVTMSALYEDLVLESV